MDMSDFVSFELAQKLKEKGFRKKCLYCYRNRDGKLFANPLYNNDATETYITTNDLLYSHNSKVESRIDAPTISQVLKWLREEKKIVFGITPMQDVDSDYLGWCITIYKVADDGYGLSWQEELYYDSYESSAIAGIEYVIDNLI